MVRKILVALDGSPASESAVRMVELLLRSVDAEICLLTVTPHESLREEQFGRAYLDGVAQAIRGKGAVVDTAVRPGPVPSTIVDTAIEGGFDLILLCSHGRGPRKMVMGGVARDILRISPVPSIVVRPEWKESIRRIVVPLDGSHRSETVLPMAAPLARAMAAEVSLLTVMPGDAKGQLLPSEVIAANLERADRWLQGEGIERTIEIRYGDPAKEILNFVGEDDLVAMSTHGRTGIGRIRYGSVAEKVMRRTGRPLLMLRTAAIPKRYRLRLAGTLRRTNAVLHDLERGPSRSPYSSH